jgi:hypothetical protein
MNQRIFVVCGTVLLAACSSGGGGGGGGGSNPEINPPPVGDQSPAGIWNGIAAHGTVETYIVTAAGAIYYIDRDRDHGGSGTVTMVNGNEMTGNYNYGLPYGNLLGSGASVAPCTLTGTVTEQQSIALDGHCATQDGDAEWDLRVDLTYDAVYERDSSLATIAGNYDRADEVLNINEAGEIFSQNAVTGCIVNGQAAVIDGDFNVYDIEFSYSSCEGDLAGMNGAVISGVAILDNSTTPEVLDLVATSEINRIFVSFVQHFTRL